MRSRLSLVFLAVVVSALSFAPRAVPAQSVGDSAAIRAAALDYMEGWYAGDAARVQRALHPDLAKRIMRRGESGVTLEHMTAATLVEYTQRGGGKNTPPAQQEKEVRILDIFGNTASVRGTMSGWVDYMHLAKDATGRWVIVNVLWELKPRG